MGDVPDDPAVPHPTGDATHDLTHDLTRDLARDPTGDLAGDLADDDAARAALARAVAAAREAGLRPGAPPRRRRPRAEPASGAAGPDARDPQLLGTGLERLMRERGWAQDVSAASVMGRWPVLVGAEIAQKAEPVSFEDGVLHVRAISTAWATQLTYMVPTMLAAIDEAVGSGVVSSIRVSGPSAPSWKKGPRRAVGRGPRDTYG